MHAFVSAAIAHIHEFNPQDLANTAWAVANIRMRDNQLMHFISAEIRGKLTKFEGSDFSSTAWAFSTLEVDAGPLLTAISSEVLHKLSSLGWQQLGTLADLDLPCQSMVES